MNKRIQHHGQASPGNITFCLPTGFQDFELWDDVGLNIPKPPDLLQLYRNSGTPLSSPRVMVDVSVEVDLGDLPGNCNTQDPPKKPDLSQQVCVWRLRRLVWFKALWSGENDSIEVQWCKSRQIFFFFCHFIAANGSCPRVGVPDKPSEQWKAEPRWTNEEIAKVWEWG